MNATVPGHSPSLSSLKGTSRTLCCRGGSVGVGNARAITLPRRPQAARAPSSQRSRPLRRGCPPPSRHLCVSTSLGSLGSLGIRLLQPGGVPHRRLVANPLGARATRTVTISSTGILVGTWLGLPTPCQAPPCGCRSWLPVFSLPHFDCLITIYSGIFKAKKH
jgi:hypothetical protein